MTVSKPSGVITLLTDFGLTDPFVGIMKGVVLERFGQARIVDLTHAIEAQAVDQAGFWLQRSFQWFPPGTVHVAVVDPGVGTAREALAVATSEYYFLAPDNGLLARVLAGDARAEVRRIDVAGLRLSATSTTFHGRDVFAPVAALLAGGRVEFGSLGPVTQPRIRPEIPVVSLANGRVEGRVVAVDRFGNLITDIDENCLAVGSGWTVVIGDARVALRHTYADVALGAGTALINSFGCVEIAVRGGRAAEVFRASIGTPVVAETASPKAVL
jgi:hypothetical protein